MHFTNILFTLLKQTTIDQLLLLKCFGIKISGFDVTYNLIMILTNCGVSVILLNNYCSTALIFVN